MKIKSLQQQYKALKKYFPKHKFSRPELPPLPENAEGWFLIPVVRENYARQLQKVLDALEDRKEFKNYLDVEEIKNYPRLNVDSLPKAGDFLVYPAQLGKRWQGKSVEEVRENLAENEFGLNSYEVGCLLLSHPALLKSDDDDLWLDCPSDEYPGAGGDFLVAPRFYFLDGKVKFVACGVVSPGGHCGSASGFVPQSKIEDGKVETLPEEMIINGVKYVKA